ncbi:MAG TPA: winged helix-turn-helix domain-containing protein [Candidatus Dormibacteraeota bacterium]|nr:winged helix-turn-helix domain-containing protein [Candidatus Dormibacteraeota bacterium]
MSSNGRPRLRFGQLELDLSEEKLLKKGVPLRLGNQPLQLLAVLLENPGEIVSREELCVRLWPDGTYVDFDEGLNTAIKKLRYALGDSAENPIFIETVPRRGYRFIAPVQKDDDASEHLQLVTPGNGDGSSNPDPLPQSVALTPPHSKRKWSAALISLALVVIVASGLIYRLAFPPALRVTQVTRLTNSGQLEAWGGLNSDGSRLFFLDREGDHWNTRQVSVAGGESMPFGSSPRNTKIFAVSRDQSEILFAPFAMRSNDFPLWSMPTVGGAPRRVGDILAGTAAFSPDGTKIAFSNSNGVFLANRDGSDVFKVAASQGWAIDWSPDGKLLRFSANGPGPGAHLWQVDSTGRHLHPFLPSWNASDGRWTADGSYYIFNSRETLWSIRESSLIPWSQPAPTQLTFPPIGYTVSLPSRDGHFVYAGGGMTGEPIDMVKFDPVSHQFKPVLPIAHVTEAVASPDSQWMLFSSWRQLWRSRPNGSDRVQLAAASPALNYHSVRWSPDSKHIVFHTLSDDNKGTIYLISSAGGAPQHPLSAGLSGSWPDWLLDGHSISYSVETDAGHSSTAESGIYVLNLDQGRSTLISGSTGLTQGRWSPDGRFLAAVSEDTSVIKLLDVGTHTWSEVARGTLISFPVWSSDSVLYFQDILAPGEPVYRFRPGGAAPQRAYSFEDILQAGVLRCGFFGFAPDGSLLVQVNRGGGDLYALTVSHP